MRLKQLNAIITGASQGLGKAIAHRFVQEGASVLLCARDYQLTTNSTTFKVTATGPGVVVTGEAYVSHDFQLRVNGRPEHYFRVNSAFKGFVVPRAGDYIISFVYWPRFFTLLLCMSGIGIAVLVSWLVVLSTNSVSPAYARISTRDALLPSTSKGT